MRTAADQQTISCMNQSLMLDLIKKEGRITRADISHALRLSPPSVSSNIEKLLKKGVILEFEASSSSSGPGRRGTLIGINQHFSYTIGISLSGPDLRVVLGDACEEIVDYRQYESLEGCSGKAIIEYIFHAVEDILVQNHIEMSSVGTIVVCTPGVIDETIGRIEFAPQITGWEELNIISTLENRFHTQVILINDINAVALGELMQGVGRKSKSFVYINIDMGIGAGIVIDGNLIKGQNSAAGEVGYMLTSVEQLDSKPQFGHLESLISLRSIRSNISRKLGIEEEALDTARINTLYKEDNFVVLQEIEYISKLLAMTIVNITAVLATPVVCLGGSISELHVDIDKHITHYIRDMVPYPPKICLSEMGNTGFIPGALHLGSKKTLEHVVNAPEL